MLRQNKLKKGTNPRGETSEYSYNALGVRVQNVQTRGNVNFRYANALLNNGSQFMKDYMAVLSDNRATWQPTWETEVGTTVQNATEKVTKSYVVDYLSVANRDIMVYEEGSFTQRNVYDHNSKRISAELTYAAETQRGEPGENIASDTAVRLQKVWYRTSHLDSTLFAVNASGAVVYHAVYDAWGNPITDTSTDLNYTGLDNRNNYTGYTWDEMLGLYFAQNRFYDAEEHRFTQEDPVKDGDNWYGYVSNEPLGYTDNTGLTSYDIYSNGKVTGSVTDFKYSSDDMFRIDELVPALGGTCKYTNDGYGKRYWTFSLNSYGFKVMVDDKVDNYGKIHKISATLRGVEKSIRIVIQDRLFVRDYIFVNIEDLNALLDSRSNYAHIMLPTSGAEVPYDPAAWNKPGIQERTNCYAYALNMKSYANGKQFFSHAEVSNLIKQMENGDTSGYMDLIQCGYEKNQITFALQPGVYSNDIFNYSRMTASAFYEFIYKDILMIPGLDVKKISQYDSVPKGYYRVCLVSGWYKDYEGRDQFDYHWYRQNPDGTWSHKPGNTEVTNLDNSDQTVYNPVTANRGFYTTVAGFYAIKRT